MRGALEYASAVAANDTKHIVALEADAGGFSPRGFNIDADEAPTAAIQLWAPLFAEYLLHWFGPGHAGVDIGPLKKLGTPLLGLMVDPQRYYSYHHSAADTFDKVNRRELHMGAAAMASILYLVDQYGLP